MYFKITAFTICFAILSVSHAQWTTRFNGEGDFSDVLNAVVSSPDGTTYAAGYTINPDVSKDILLIKYNSAGDTVWTRQYAGAGEGPDEAFAMALDPSGNIIVTGYQKGEGTGFDFITLKYSPAGLLIWTAVYNYSTNESDQSNTLIVDDAGNVYIAGQSDKDNSPVNDDDFVVIKYNSAGIQQWAKRSDGFGGSTDRPAAMAFGSDGHIIVTGRSSNGNDDDYLTIKYNSGTGNEMWRTYFDRTHHDRATDIAIDAVSGKIFVTGRSNNGDNYDYGTVCYNTSGVEQWQAIFDYVEDDRATHVGLDNTGNVYVVGQSDGDASTIVTNYNILIVKYNTSGTQQFVQSYNGTGDNDDIPTDLYVDASGNATITGITDMISGAEISNDIVALRYTNAGTLSWSNAFGTTGVQDIADAASIDASGNMYIAGYTEQVPDRNAHMLKINNSGNEVWTSTFNGTGDNGDNMHAIVRDGMNNVFLGGYTTAFGADRNFLVMKLGADGDIIWTRTFNGTSTKQSTDDAISITIDSDNNIYAAGFLKNSGTGYDIFVCKISNSGDSLWSYQYNDATSNETDKAISIHVSTTGNVTICGRSDQDPTAVSNDDILLIRLNNSGIQQWVARYNGIGDGDDRPTQMVVTTAGNIYVAGKTFNGSDIDAVVIKYNTSGIQQWVKKYDGGFGDDEAIGMLIDAAENLYIGGNTTSASGDHDLLFLSYNASGTQLNVAAFDLGVEGDDETKSIAFDLEGMPTFAATSSPDTSDITLNGDISIVKFDTEGNYQWHAMYDGGAHDDASEISFHPSTGLVLCGQTEAGTATAQDYDYVTLYVDDAGSITSTELYNGTGAANDVANTLITRENGTYVSGGSMGAGAQRDIVTILYGSTPLSSTINPDTQEIRSFPVPTTDLCNIDLSIIPNGESVNITLMSISGYAVKSYQTIAQDIFTFSAEDLPAGLYTILIQTNNTQYNTTCIKQ